jgi:GNAT superfamily N-acetyltransferase
MAPTLFPAADSPDLTLSHPQLSERLKLWTRTAPEWKGVLSTEQYLEESRYLASLQDTRHAALKQEDWILVDKNLPADERHILSSCETFRKRALIRRAGGSVAETTVYGIASVFTAPEYRRKGYAKRMMLELRELLMQSWYCSASILYSDIGKKFYSEIGWHPLPSNSHLEFPPVAGTVKATRLFEPDLKELCNEDEMMIRKAMSSRASDGKTRVMILPDHTHMLWHHVREEFRCEKLFGKFPKAKGAMAGKFGSRVWVVWTHKLHGKPDNIEAGNTLYILRLVIEKQGPEGNVAVKDREEVKENLKIVVQSAQAEAIKWKLQSVKLWDPSPLTRELVQEMGIRFLDVEREEEGIASVLFNLEGGEEDGLEWLSNEKFAWC